MRALLSIICLTALLAVLAAGDVPEAAGKPDIVLFISDQHVAEVPGSAGNTHVMTPALDGLAATGVRFRNTYCVYPVCIINPHLRITGRCCEVGCGRASRRSRSAAFREPRAVIQPFAL
jgi:hypothetical protein